jgi:hypothetical protein
VNSLWDAVIRALDFGQPLISDDASGTTRKLGWSGAVVVIVCRRAAVIIVGGGLVAVL